MSDFLKRRQALGGASSAASQSAGAFVKRRQQLAGLGYKPGQVKKILGMFPLVGGPLKKAKGGLLKKKT